MAAPTRRRVVVTAPGAIDVVDAPRAPRSSGEASVSLLVAGVCGSDTAGVRGTHAFFAPPYHPGHEVVGVVDEIDPDNGVLRPGDRVVVEPTLPCGDCKTCRGGRENVCERLDFFGCGFTEGGMADQFVVPVDRLHRVPASVSDLDAALIEPLATACHAVRLAGPLAGRSVVVVGAGTIGLLTLAVARSHGPRQVVVVDPLAPKRSLAVRLGADAVLDADGDVATAARDALGESADVVFDCVAGAATVAASITMALKGGTVVVVGGARRPVEVDLPRLQEYEVRLQGAITYTRADFEAAIAHVAAGLVSAEDLVTGRFPLHEAARAFAAVGAADQVKVLVVGDRAPAMTEHRSVS
ncbi:zinc-binding dehydrogenase [Nocardioides sp. SYSU D00065]|uniref:zinc-dependent alcohol dehydrogenase n=1 Tax=Nocardioides sp. SYSU D00065 TaxID=2817378 RepID=UPI001B3408CD|nr:alcohol dehydrogenase catalytic domain-containing protein [Nocardioides sp. SYSU D00065]